MEQASAEELEHTGSAKNGESGLSATERAVGKYARAALAKRKRNRGVCPEHQIMRGEESQDGREPHLSERGGIRAAV